MKPAAGARTFAIASAGYAALTALSCAGVLFLGRLPYFRDVGTHFYPQYVMVASALRQGVWPTWDPGTGTGVPVLATYVVDLGMLALLGARRVLQLSPPFHVWLAMTGAFVLARALGCRPLSAWAAGAVFGLSGVFQSMLNLVPLAQAAAWAPLVIAAYLRCFREPTGRSAALLAAVAAVQASTLGGEIALQTALCALVLTPRVPTRAEWRALGTAAALAAGLAAPVALGLRAVLHGTARARGFGAAQALGWSAHPLALVEMAFPRFLGDPHTMTDLGYWGQPLFPERYPYLIALYLGPLVLALAACAGRGHLRLWILAAAGVLLALGSYGPFGRILSTVLPQFRSPVKYLFLTTLAIALLAGHGLDRAGGARRTRAIAGLASAGALLLALGLALRIGPVATRAALAAVWHRLAAPEAEPLAAIWGAALVATGLLAVAAATALWRGGRLAFAPAACLVADLLVTNGHVDPSTPGAFYDLRPEVAALIARAPDAHATRWFTYPLAETEGVRWSPAVLARNEDFWLYYADRQSLWAGAKTLDGLDGAYDEDRTGWSPEGSTFSAGDSNPVRHAANHARLRLAGVRYLLAFTPLPPDLAAPLGGATLPAMGSPLLLHELRDALPRAFWVPDCEVAPSRPAAWARLTDPAFDVRRHVVLEQEPIGRTCGRGAAGASAVSWRREGPHSIVLEAKGDAGYVVFLESFHPDWRVESPDSGVALQRGNGRYWVLSVPRGDVVVRVRFRPAWVWPAFASAATAALLVLVLVSRRQPPAGPGAEKLDTSSSVALASGD